MGFSFDNTHLQFRKHSALADTILIFICWCKTENNTNLKA